jgi:hypothetical protein
MINKCTVELPDVFPVGKAAGAWRLPPTPMRHRDYECRHFTEAAMSLHVGVTHNSLSVLPDANGRPSTAVTAARVLFGHTVIILTDHGGSNNKAFDFHS